MVPPEAVSFAKQVVARAKPAGPNRAKAMLYAASRVAAFALACGAELSPEAVLCPAFVERFVVNGGRAMSAPTRRTLRTNLRAIARALDPYVAPQPVPLPRERAKAPYTPTEVSAFLALADAQPTPARANRASALVCLGAGAGLVRSDLRGLRGSDVSARSGGVVAAVRGPRPRAVPVLARYHSRLLANAAFAGDGLLISGGDPFRHNVTTPLVSSLAGGEDLPRLEQGRLRATWLAEAASLVGLRAFMDAAGVDCSQRLGDIVAGLAALPEPDAVALLGGQQP